jgi:hypothetical protein
MPRRNQNASQSGDKPSRRTINTVQSSGVAQCQAKVRYANAEDADNAFYDATIVRPDTPLATYQCLQCFGWHLTSRTRIT